MLSAMNGSATEDRSPVAHRAGRTPALLAVVTALALLVLLAPLGAVATDEPPPGSVGTAMPNVALPSIGGPTIAPGALAGKVVLYEFWATWCTPCHVQVEILAELYPASLAAGIEFVGVATGEPEDLVAAHLAKHPSLYPVLLDRDEKLGTALQVLGLPTLVVVDRTGKIAWRNTGLTDRSTLEAAFVAAGARLAPLAP